MDIIKTREDLRERLLAVRNNQQSIGFVATMGALHDGHLALLETAKQKSQFVVCSIFVNPTQFNDVKDLEIYPRPIENDVQLLTEAGCDVLFQPEINEMYDGLEAWSMDLGQLDSVWEGEKRPGHYQGVTQIVNKLFDLIEPDLAFFGQKDYQQCLVIKELIRQKNIPIELVICPTVREKSGLALSSRNARLTIEGRQRAVALSSILFYVKDSLKSSSIPEMSAYGLSYLRSAQGIQVEYFAICNADDLTIATSKEEPLIAICAAWVEGVRLIDNMLL